MARTDPTQVAEARPPRRALLTPGLRLARWENCLFAYGATAVGFASAADPHQAPWRLVVAGSVVSLVLAFGNVVNDLLDEEVDTRSKPWRPLPSGRMRRRDAVGLSGCLAVAAAMAAVPLGLVLFVIAVVMLGLAYAYSARLKRVPLLGNLSVAVQVGGIILVGALCAGDPTGGTVIASALVTMYALTLEVAKTVEDQDADGAVGLTTIAHLVDRSNQGALVLLLAVASGAAAIAVGVVRGVPSGYWVVLAPLVPLIWMASRWKAGPTGSRPPITGFLRASKALWCVALLGLTMVS